MFCNPASLGAPAKLRVAYECFPLALIVEAAGGLALCSSSQPLLDLVLESHDQRSAICLGSRGEVEACREAMADGGQR